MPAGALWYAGAMPAKASQRPPICIVGPGRLGAALAINLHRSGWKVEKLVVRSGRRKSGKTGRLARAVGASVAGHGESELLSGLVWITVPDDRIASVAEALAARQDWRGVTVFHSSGALSSDALQPLRAKGARVASVHPGMTFVAKSAPSLRGVPFGVEGDPAALRLARRIITDVGGTAVTIRKENKVLYHAFDAFASPLLIALMAGLESVGKAAGIPEKKLRAMAGPLLRQTLENYLQHGAAAAFSGPFVRGDVEVVHRHLKALRRSPAARAAYSALAHVAVKKLPVGNRARLGKLLREAD